MAYNIALQFEDGVTRIIPCDANELVADAAYRAKINIPLDCRDGACGTCKCHCESGKYTMGVYIEDALTDDEAANGYVLTCQMKPTSDCVIKVPASSAACKTEVGTFGGRLTTIGRDSATTVSFSLQAEQPLAFLPGQYVNLQVPGSKETRSYSFSSPPNQTELSFLIRDVPDGLMSTYMRSKANPDDFMMFSRPVRQLLSAPDHPADPDARRRHRACAVPVDAAVAEGQPDRPADHARLWRQHQRRPGRARHARRAQGDDAELRLLHLRRRQR